MARYPLAAVQALKKDAEELAARALASAIDAHARAVEGRERADARRREHVEATARVEQDERARDAAGRSVAEALTAQAWLRQRKVELTQLVGALDAARREEAERAQAIDAARSQLASARAEVEALEKHRAKWEAEEARVLERREEAEADDRAMRRPS